MTIVTYEIDTKKVISVVPVELVFEGEVSVVEGDGIIEDEYDYIIYNGTEPIFNTVEDTLYLNTDSVILDGDWL